METEYERAARILGCDVDTSIRRALNPETMFKLAPTPMHKTEAEINAMVDEDERMTRAFLARRNEIAANDSGEAESEQAKRARQAMLDAGWEP